MPDTNYPQTGSGLLTVDDKGHPPKSRLSDFQAALTVVDTLRQANDQRNAKGARVNGMFQGNPPFNQTKLNEAGLKHYPNINTLEGKAYASSALVPYYDLFSSVPYYVEVTLDIADTEQRETFSRIVTEELHRTVNEGLWFELAMWKLLNDFVKFGKGYAIWTDPVSWRFKRVAWHRVWFPDDTDVDSDEWEYFAVLWHYNAHDLFRRVRNKERATAAGWNVEAVLKAIQSAARYEPSNISDWMSIQRQLNDQDLAADSQIDKITTAWLFVREFDGRWSWMVLPMTALTATASSKLKRTEFDFLFRKDSLYANVQQIIAPFWFEVFDGSINGLSGLGKDIYSPMQLKDRMACAKINNVFMRSSVLMQARTGTGRQKAQLAQIGNVCVIPEGYEVQQSTILGDIESTIAVGQDIDRMLQSNTGIYRPQFEKPAGNPETATAAQLRFQQGTVLSNSAVNRFHRQEDQLYGEVFRRIVRSSEKEARTFRQWCLERGVPEEALSKTRSVRAYRNVGNGSPFLRQTNIAALMTFFPEFPEDGKRAFLEDAVAAYTGQQKVERYVRTRQAADIPDRHVWEATQENAALKEGAPVVWTPDQQDETHLAVHAQALSGALQGTQQGADPAAVAVFGQGILQHAGAHFQSLQRRGRKQQVKLWTGLYKQLGQGVEALMRQAQQAQQQAQQRQQQLSEQLTDQQLEAQAVQAKLALSGAKTAHQMKLREQQALQKMTIADISAAAKIERERLSSLDMDSGNGE